MNTHSPATILIVDDEPNTRVVLHKLLASHSYQVDAAKDAQEALAWLDQNTCDVMLIDYKMPGMNGIELAHAVHQHLPDIKTIIVTAHGTISMAVQAMKEGVHDYLTKPVNPDELLLTIERALEHKRLASQVSELRKELGERYEFHNIIGKSKAMQQVFDIIEKASQTDVTVLIQGDTGTGKELVARAIHFNSVRRAKPLVAVSCVAFQENILESELFGHVEGAFTGAIRDKVGRFEMSDGGSLFLDDVNLIPPNIQAKLLRVLEERKFERVGGTKQIQVDIRLISSTNVNLEDEVRKGAFRSDLYHRINVLTINLPPLRDRKEDIPLLTQHFLKKACQAQSKSLKEVAPAVMQRFFLYSWPGNVRELENAIDSAVVLCEGDTIEPSHIPAAIQNALPREGDIFDTQRREDLSLMVHMDIFERHLIIQALARANQNTTDAAAILGVSPRTLRNKIQKHRLRP